jgi:deoxycitidine kinase/deoxyguanosine kinase
MVFAKMLYDSGKIEEVNFQIYLNMFDTFLEDYFLNKVVYVKTTPEICKKRIVTRSREGESAISLDYLKICSNYHEQMLDKSSTQCVCQQQLVLNGNIDLNDNENQLNEWINEIHNFINA